MSALSIATAKEVFELLRDDLAAIEQEFTRSPRPTSMSSLTSPST